MSQSVIGALRANLGLDSARFESGARRARSTANTLRRDIARIGAGIAAIGTGLAVAIRGQLQSIDDVGKAADRIGVPVETLSRLQHAANLSAVANGNLEASLQRLAREMVENERKFTDLGIAVRNADGTMRPIEGVLGDLADRLMAMPQGAERTALAYELMGRQGAALIPMLQGGSAGLRAMTDEADRLGLTVSGETSAAAAQFNDNLTRLAAAMRGFVQIVAAQMAPALVTITDAVVAAVGGFRDLPDWMQRTSIAVVAVTAVLGPLVGGLALVAVSLGTLLSPVLIAVGAFAAIAGVAALFMGRTENLPDRMDAVAASQDTLNTAMGDFAASGAPQAGGAALNYARDLEQQASAALAAAEAELALMQAEQARFANAPIEERGLLGDMTDANIADDVAAARVEIDDLRKTLNGARRTIDALSRSEDVLSEANRQLAVDATTVSVETGELAETLSDVVTQSVRAGGVLPTLTSELEQVGQAAETVDARVQRAGQTLGGLFVAATRGAGDLRSAVSQLLSRLTDALANRAFTSLLNRGTGSGSGGGGWLGGLIDLLSFEGGGFTGFGARVGGLDGRGGFAAMLHPNEMVIDQTRAPASSGGALQVDIGFDASMGGFWAAVRDETGREIARARPAIVRDAVGATRASVREVPLR